MSGNLSAGQRLLSGNFGGIVKHVISQLWRSPTLVADEQAKDAFVAPTFGPIVNRLIADAQADADVVHALAIVQGKQGLARRR